MFKKVKSEKGFGLIEVLMSLALLGIIAVTFITAINVASRAILVADERTTAESLARSQMESLKKQQYVYDENVIDTEYATYNIINTSEYPGFAIYSENWQGNVIEENYIIGIPWNSETGAYAPADVGLQMIKLVIMSGDDVVLTLEDYKVDRY